MIQYSIHLYIYIYMLLFTILLLAIISHEIFTRYCYCLPFMAGYTMKYTQLLLISTFLLSSIINNIIRLFRYDWSYDEQHP